MNHDLRFAFHVPFSGTVDSANGVIRGVSLMTGNLTAEGHDLEVDETTLRQVLACAKKTGKIPVKLDHGSGITSLCGFIDGATAVIDAGTDGRKKVRGDWHLLRTHEQYQTLIERATMMPECFGMSAAFKGSGELLKAGDKKGRKAARCERLLAVDCVTQPAANPDGLFSQTGGSARSASTGLVDTRRRGMADETLNPNDPQMPAWAQQLMDKLTTIETRVAGFEQFQDEVHAALNEPSLDELAAMDDAQLAELGLTREQVDAAVAEAEAGGDLGAGPSARAGNPNGGGQPAGGGAPATTAMSAGDRALKEVIELKSQMARQAQAEERAEVEHAFAVVEEKVTALSEQNAALAKKNGELEAEVKALKLFNKTGTSRPAPGMESVTLFSGKGAAAGSFEALVSSKITELKSANGKLTEAAALSQAVQFCIRTHTDAYADYRQRGGKIQL